MDVVAWLEQVRKIDELINAKIAERDRYAAMAVDINSKPLSAVPYGGSGLVSRKVEDAVVNLITLSDEINKLVDQYVNHKQKVIEILEKLPDKEYGVLHRRYIRYMTWEKIAEDMDYSPQHVMRIKKKALENLTSVMLCSIV